MGKERACALKLHSVILPGVEQKAARPRNDVAAANSSDLSIRHCPCKDEEYRAEELLAVTCLEDQVCTKELEAELNDEAEPKDEDLLGRLVLELVAALTGGPTRRGRLDAERVCAQCRQQRPHRPVPQPRTGARR